MPLRSLSLCAAFPRLFPCSRAEKNVYNAGGVDKMIHHPHMPAVFPCHTIFARRTMDDMTHARPGGRFCRWWCSTTTSTRSRGVSDPPGSCLFLPLVAGEARRCLLDHRISFSFFVSGITEQHTAKIKRIVPIILVLSSLRVSVHSVAVQKFRSRTRP